MKPFLLECHKSQRKRIWLVMLAMVLFEGLWMIVGFHRSGPRDRAQGYALCLYQAAILNAIVLPVLISVLASRVCDMEHKGSALKSLLTMQKPGSLFDAKFAFIALHMAAAVLLQTGSFLLIGKVYGFTAAVPVRELLLYPWTQLLPSLFFALLIQALSLSFVNAFIPLVAGLIGGFLGLMSLFFSPWIARFVPSSYFGLLSTVGMNWDEETRIVDYFYKSFPIWDFLVLLSATAIVYLVCRRRFANREV